MTERISIAVGVDDSWSTNGAVDWALQEAELSAAPIRVLHVVGDEPPAGMFHDGRRAEVAAKQLLRDVCDYLDRHDRVGFHTSVLLSGTPAATLARTTDHDRMLVVGRHGRSRLSRLLIGSTAETVAYESGTAVIVVPPQWSSADHAGPVVVAVDEFDYCEAAVDLAVGLAEERRVPILLVHVWDVPATFTGDELATASAVETAYRHQRDRLDKIVRRCQDRYPDTTFETELRRGHTVTELIEAAEERDAQLLAVGGRTHRRLTAVLLGRTARGVLRHATGPAAIAHERAIDA